MARDVQARHRRSMASAVHPEAVQTLPDDHRVRSWYGEFSKECMLRESFDAAAANDTIEPPFSCHAGNGVRPSSNQTFIMPSQISLAANSGHWFRTTFLMSGNRRPHQNQSPRRMKDAEATGRRNDAKGKHKKTLNFPPVGGMQDGDKICQIMALRGRLRAQGNSIQGKGLGSWETSSRARTCAMTITSQRMRGPHQQLLWTPARYHRMTLFEPGTQRMWNERCGVLGILRKTWRNNYRTCSRRCRPKRDWNCSCGHGNMWTVVSKSSYRMTLQLSLAFQCGSSYMPWKQQKLHKNAQSTTPIWKLNPVTLGNPTTEQRKAGRGPEEVPIHTIAAPATCRHSARQG